MFRQRLRLWFRVVGDQRFLSHHDMMRLWERAMRRAGLPLRMSEGYNPRPRFSLSEPRQVGVASDAELIEFELADWINPDAVLERLRRQLPEGIAAESMDLVRPTDKARPEAVVYVARLETATSAEPAQAGSAERKTDTTEPSGSEFPDELSSRIAQLLAQSSLPVVRRRPTGDKSLDARPFIESVELVQAVESEEPLSLELTAPVCASSCSALRAPRSALRMVLRTGPGGTVRPDEVLRLLGLEAEAVARADIRRVEIRLR